MENLETKIKQVISDKIAALDRPDLYRSPLVAFSSATDERYAELKKTIGDWHLTPTELMPEAKTVISYFVPFTKEVIASPKASKDGSLAWGESYSIINQYFDNVNEAISEFLTGLGFYVKTIKSTHTYDPKDMKSMWSHRSAAVIAGLGSFGANRMVITEKGSGGRFCTVLTSAEIEAPRNPEPERCLYIKDGTCGLCFKICPPNALTSDGIDKFACQDELDKNNRIQKDATGYDSDTCGKCISVCPWSYLGSV